MLARELSRLQKTNALPARLVTGRHGRRALLACTRGCNREVVLELDL
jgi:hypothetical protein